MVEPANAEQTLGSNPSALAQLVHSLLKTYHAIVSRIASQTQCFMNSGK
jgi:hypothetical protein